MFVPQLHFMSIVTTLVTIVTLLLINGNHGIVYNPCQGYPRDFCFGAPLGCLTDPLISRCTIFFQVINRPDTGDITSSTFHFEVRSPNNVQLSAVGYLYFTHEKDIALDDGKLTLRYII